MKAKKLTQTRGTTHGDFHVNAVVSQSFKRIMSVGSYTDVQKEALDLICMKLSRIASGKPNHIDAWRDIQGYCQLVMDELATMPGATDHEVKLIVVK